MDNFIIIAILVVIVAFATAYIIRYKKSGKKCIGCPSGGCSSKESGCSKNCSGCSGNCSKK